MNNLKPQSSFFNSDTYSESSISKIKNPCHIECINYALDIFWEIILYLYKTILESYRKIQDIIWKWITNLDRLISYRRCRTPWKEIWFYHLVIDQRTGAWHRWTLVSWYYHCHLYQRYERHVLRKRAEKVNKD